MSKIDIWEDFSTFNGSQYGFSLTFQAPDYGIQAKKIWILALNPKSFPLGMEFRTSKRLD